MIAAGQVHADKVGPGVYLILRPYPYRTTVWDCLVLEEAFGERAGEVVSLQDDWLNVCAEQVTP